MDMSGPKSAAAVLLVLCLLGLSSAHAATPTLLNAKQSAQARGFVFETSHEEIVAKAKKEGKLRVISSLETETYKQLIATFKQKYPFLDFSVNAVDGTEEPSVYCWSSKREWEKTGTLSIYPETFTMSLRNIQKKSTSSGWLNTKCWPFQPQ